MRTVAMLCRHGEEQAARRETEHLHFAASRVPLSQAGEAQARTLAQRVIELGSALHLTLHPVIDAAPCLSSYQTAMIVADMLSRAARRPFRVDQHPALGPAREDLELAELGSRVAMHLRSVVAELSSKSRASKLKVFIGHGSMLLAASEELGACKLGSFTSSTLPHGHPVLLEWTARGAWRALDVTLVDARTTSSNDVHDASRS